METGRKSNESTRLKETGMVKVECQKQTPPGASTKQAYQTNNVLDLRRQTKVFCNISGMSNMQSTDKFQPHFAAGFSPIADDQSSLLQPPSRFRQLSSAAKVAGLKNLETWLSQSPISDQPTNIH